MKRTMRGVFPYLLAAVVVLPLSGCDAFLLRQYVPDESGFDGAVRTYRTALDGNYGVVWVQVPYLDLEARGRVGLAKMYVHRRDFRVKRPLPALFHAHYAVNASAAKFWCDRGWAVFSPLNTEADGAYPLDAAVGNSHNLNRAIIQWIRRLPYIDRSRLHIDGASQGGYMSLAMSADMFPVTAATADCPIVNWAYNLTYVEANRSIAYGPVGCASSPLPAVCSVLFISNLAFAHFGNDLTDDVWLRISPIAWIDRIANPVLITAATGDMLTPINQMSRVHVRPFDHDRFPPGYVNDFDALTLNEAARIPFEEALPSGSYYVNVMTPDEVSGGLQDKPWFAGVQWNLLYLDEGPPEPNAGHTVLNWPLFPESYVAHYKNVVPSVDILNAAKMLHLMERYTLTLSTLPQLADGRLGNRLNFPLLERRDVLTGLLDYARLGDAHFRHLVALYRACPIRPFGSEITVNRLEQELDALLKAL